MMMLTMMMNIVAAIMILTNFLILLYFSIYLSYCDDACDACDDDDVCDDGCGDYDGYDCGDVRQILIRDVCDRVFRTWIDSNALICLRVLFVSSSLVGSAYSLVLEK